ncbi:hypothetical protein KOW79_014040 [Hemibagrus wyckioides]|uniref:Uncharacterized protein n=1 Tax=Hemibagrus wyckioides TaxID=337641 RepID=A0A9D3NJ27_9TELE|nr:hypothetical protein KOW79_014040 [Hemibagrus wyckioides]
MDMCGGLQSSAVFSFLVVSSHLKVSSGLEWQRETETAAGPRGRGTSETSKFQREEGSLRQKPWFYWNEDFTIRLRLPPH